MKAHCRYCKGTSHSQCCILIISPPLSLGFRMASPWLSEPCQASTFPGLCPTVQCSSTSVPQPRRCLDQVSDRAALSSTSIGCLHTLPVALFPHNNTGTSFLNRGEASMCEKIVTQFLRGGVTPPQVRSSTPCHHSSLLPPSHTHHTHTHAAPQIGVITPYEGQRAYIKQYMQRHGVLRQALYNDIEVCILAPSFSPLPLSHLSFSPGGECGCLPGP